MSFISKRYAKSGYLDCNVNNYKKRINHILYFDFNNLYPSMFLFDLPIGDYKFESKKVIQQTENELKKIKILQNCNLKNRGMYLEVDLEYPIELHAVHSDFALAPDRYNICYNELSPINKFLDQK